VCTQVQIPNSISISSAIFAQLMVESLYFTTGRPISPLKLPLPMRHLDPPLIHDSLGAIRGHNPNGTSIGSAVFAQLTAKCPVLYNGLPLLPQNCPFHGDLDPHLIHGSFSPPVNPNGISVGSAIFARLTTVTDRQTDRQTWSVTTGRIYIHSTVM